MKKSLTTLVALLLLNVSFGQLTPFQGKKAWGFADPDGKIVVQPIYSAVGYFEKGYTWVNIGGKNKKGNFPEGGKWGIIDSTGTVVCPVQYEFVDLCNDDGIVAINIGGQMKDTILYGGKWGYYTLSEKKELIPPCYTAISQMFCGKGAWVSESDAKCTYRIRCNKDMVDKDVELSPVFYVSDDEVVTQRNVSKQLLSWKYVDYNGNILCNGNFDNVYGLQNGLFSVKKNGKLGRTNLSGNIVMPCEYIWMGNNGDGNVFWAKSGSKVYLFSEDGQKISEKGYNKTSIFYDSVAFAAEKDSTYCLINNRGEELTPFIYTKINEFCHGYATVFAGSQHLYIIDTQGKQLLDTDFKTVPIKFGNTIFNDNGKPYSWGTRMDGTTVWFNVDGEIIQDSTKKEFGIGDKIPEGLWNY